MKAEYQSGRQKGVQGDLPLKRKVLREIFLVENGIIDFGAELVL
jgi:hypothetical protein